MRVTTIGTGTISLTAGRACASHLVEAGMIRMLLDCGSGAAHRMSSLGLDWWGLTHLAISHFHTDHIGDLPTLLFAYKYARRPGRTAPLTVLGPAGTRALIEKLGDAFGTWMRELGFPLTVVEVDPDSATDLGDDAILRVTKVPHTEESVAYSLEQRGQRVVYSGDTGFAEEFARWAAGSDVLLCECSLPASFGVSTHLTPAECGRIGAIAAPGILVLTHIYPPLEDVDLPAELVAAGYDGRVVVATDGWFTEIEDG